MSWKELEAKKGIYLLKHHAYSLWYIGKTKDLDRRMQEHSVKGYQLMAFFPEENINETEIELITFTEAIGLSLANITYTSKGGIHGGTTKNPSTVTTEPYTAWTEIRFPHLMQIEWSSGHCSYSQNQTLDDLRTSIAYWQSEHTNEVPNHLLFKSA